MSASQIAMIQPLTSTTQQTIVWLCYRLLSPSYSVASCRCSAGCFHVGNMDILGYHNISYLINASIYLVKGGRLSLLLGVLFHSCRPSFRHTGVMFLDFCVPNTMRVY